ncbi:MULTISPECIES: Kelch repeat-containing protein [Maribacter]|uniref:Kelch repeat-containing protein n=1 Tax=Maribacter flavus TaxID=1658664 RepID=A0ABU7IHC1_9FLAO|nr:MULTISPECIES: kelch repeat-containing protein [Maribacter]MDC6404940.1 hypothetical protein [Maribacter sp. PR66]MEE1972354.1 kelch repeat-containing protein [Maribacter flavus]
MKRLFLMTLTAVLILACNNDDTPSVIEEITEETEEETVEEEQEPQPSPEEILSAERAEIITEITADNEKVWRIASAILTNSNGSFNITGAFNIVDDEFIFKNTVNATGKSEFKGSLVWNPGFAFDIGALSEVDALTELYASPAESTFDFVENSSTQIEAFNNNFVLDLSTQNPMATWDFGDNRSMELTLVPKLATDYQQVPSSMLEFTEAFTFASNFIDSGAPGMVGSLTSNSFYLANREYDPTLDANIEKIRKFDISSGSLSEKINPLLDFVSKQVNIIDDKIYVAGGQRINIYDLELQNDPVSTQDYGAALGIPFLGLSRFGTAVLGNKIYIVGGDLDNNLTDKILVFDTETQTLEEFATMPEPRSGARAEIVNDKLYIFGGQTAFFTPPAKDTIYIFDLNTSELTVEQLPTAIDFSFTGRTQNLIYVAGRIETVSPENMLLDREPYLGVYDTNTGVFTELETNLSSPNLETIHSMAVFNDKIYVVFGQGQAQEEGQFQTWSILSADI